MLNQDYKEMLQCLQKHGVDFVIVGAYALAAYGLPRATGDIDIFIRPSSEHAHKVMTALRDFGAPLQDITVADFQQPGTVFQIGVEPCRIDLLTEIDGVSFAQAWGHRRTIEVDDLTVAVISREDLILNKRATARPKDLLDLDWLLANR